MTRDDEFAHGNPGSEPPTAWLHPSEVSSVEKTSGPDDLKDRRGPRGKVLIGGLVVIALAAAAVMATFLMTRRPPQSETEQVARRYAAASDCRDVYASLSAARQQQEGTRQEFCAQHQRVALNVAWSRDLALTDHKALVVVAGSLAGRSPAADDNSPQAAQARIRAAAVIVVYLQREHGEWKVASVRPL